MTIRPYYPQDHEGCLLIFDSNIPCYFAIHEREQFEFWLRGQDEGIPAYAETKAEHYYVAEQDGELVACGGFSIVKDKPVANMTWGMVARRMHGQGMGRQLFQYRIDKIASLYHGHTIRMDTSQHTYPFFEKFGFEVTGITENSYAPGLHRYDMVLDKVLQDQY